MKHTNRQGVSEFAPPMHQKFLSYICGCLSTICWQSFVTANSYTVGVIIQGIIIINNPSYQPERWQGTLFVYAVTILTTIINIWGAKYLPRMEIIFVVCHVLFFFPVLITLLVMAPMKQSAGDVFLNFTDDGGNWPSRGLDVMVGQVAASFILLGEHSPHYDSLLDKLIDRFRCTGTSCRGNARCQLRCTGKHVLVVCLEHTSNTCNALDLPLLHWQCSRCTCDPHRISIHCGFFIGYWIGSRCFDPHGNYRPAFVFRVCEHNDKYESTDICVRKRWRLTLLKMVEAGERLSTLPSLLLLPLSAQIDPYCVVPVNALIFTCFYTFALSLINIGSTVAFGAILSLSTSALMATYAMAIGCMTYRKLYAGPELAPLPIARWSLGKYGTLINGLGLFYACWSLFWSLWSSVYHPTAADFNWAPVILICLLGLAGLLYILNKKDTYNSPVAIIRSFN
jgi:Amino acid permease